MQVEWEMSISIKLKLAMVKKKQLDLLFLSWAWWHIHGIVVLGKLRQEVHYFEISLDSLQKMFL